MIAMFFMIKCDSLSHHNFFLFIDLLSFRKCDHALITIKGWLPTSYVLLHMYFAVLVTTFKSSVVCFCGRNLISFV